MLNYANYYEDIQLLKAQGVEAIHKTLFTDDYVPLVQLITFKNVVKYALKVSELQLCFKCVDSGFSRDFARFDQHEREYARKYPVEDFERYSRNVQLDS